ncbi:MAG TPA: alpha-ketoacid dehydrogenase subunit beta [Firmicutes bacterium]|jgi:pyruvate dehydrogenase E1 component beta subunit|nr:alpha-ketoacid dehydrogenase subunit beta [Bacillota bacterium]
MAEMTLLQAINAALFEQMRKDKSVVVFGEDAGFEGGVFRVTKGLQQEFGVDRVFDTPISEAGIIGAAIGMAINGLKPVVEFQFEGFMFNGFNQIAVHLGRMRNRSRGKYSVPLVLRMPWGGGIRALEHHSEAVESFIAHIPGIKIVIPATPYDAKGLMTAAIQDPDPVVFFEPKKIYRAFKQEVPETEYIVPIGKARVVQEGSDITVVAWGSMVREVQTAIKQLENDNISVELIDLRTIVPMDTETIVNSVKKTGRILVVHEAVRTLGFATEIITRVVENAFLSLEAPPTRLTGFDIAVPLPRGEHHQMVEPKRIAHEIKTLVDYKV